MRDLLEFGQAVFSHWVALMSGAISLAITFIEKVKSNTIALRTLYVISIACIFTAFFFSWKDEKDRFYPGLRIHIDQTNIAPAPPSSTLLTLVVSVKNVGDPSVLEDCSSTVTFADGSQIIGRRLVVPEPLTLEGHEGKQVFLPGSALYDRMATPLAKGGKTMGISMFTLPNISSESLREGTKVHLSCKDVIGNTIEAVHSLGPQRGSPQFFPGLSERPNN